MTASEAARNAREKAMGLIREHAMARQHDVVDGLMTTRLAALMAQRHAMGVLDTFTALYGDRASGPLACGERGGICHRPGLAALRVAALGAATGGLGINHGVKAP